MLLTIEQEVEAIWMRKFSIPSLLYLVMRFCTLGYIVLDISMSLSIFGLPSVNVSPLTWFSLILLTSFCRSAQILISQYARGMSACPGANSRSTSPTLWSLLFCSPLLVSFQSRLSTFSRSHCDVFSLQFITCLGNMGATLVPRCRCSTCRHFTLRHEYGMTSLSLRNTSP